MHFQKWTEKQTVRVLHDLDSRFKLPLLQWELLLEGMLSAWPSRH